MEFRRSSSQRPTVRRALSRSSSTYAHPASQSSIDLATAPRPAARPALRPAVSTLGPGIGTRSRSRSVSALPDAFLTRRPRAFGADPASSSASHRSRRHLTGFAGMASDERPLFSIASLSLGNVTSGHRITDKIAVAGALGYDAVEIFVADFEAYVSDLRSGSSYALSSLPPNSPSPSDLSDQALDTLAANALRTLASSHRISLPVVQPFRGFENFARQPRSKLDDSLAEAERWFRLMPTLGASLLLVCSNHLHPSPNPLEVEDELRTKQTWTEYRDAQVEAMRELGELAEKYSIRVGYEALGFGTVVNQWQQVWDVVDRVDRPNVGIILDSFNQLSQIYATPDQPPYVHPSAAFRLHANLSELIARIDVSKLFLVQIADGARPAAPFSSSAEMPSRMRWSRTSRLYAHDPAPPGDRGGFLPVNEFMQAMLEIGYRGYWSLEVYNESLAGEGKEVMWEHGRRGIVGLEDLWKSIRGSGSDSESDGDGSGEDPVPTKPDAGVGSDVQRVGASEVQPSISRQLLNEEERMVRLTGQVGA